MSSALFKDEKGVSVDQRKERTETETIDELKNFFDKRLKGIVSLLESDVMDTEAVLIPKPSVMRKFTKATKKFYWTMYKHYNSPTVVTLYFWMKMYSGQNSE